MGASENTMYSASAAPADARRSDHWLMESISNPPISEGRRSRRLGGRRMGRARAGKPIVGTDAARRNLPFVRKRSHAAVAGDGQVRPGRRKRRADGARRCDPRAQKKTPGHPGFSGFACPGRPRAGKAVTAGRSPCRPCRHATRHGRGSGLSSASSTTAASAVSSRLATEAAFCRAVRVTLVGSSTPCSTRSVYSPVAAL